MKTCIVDIEGIEIFYFNFQCIQCRILSFQDFYTVPFKVLLISLKFKSLVAYKIE